MKRQAPHSAPRELPAAVGWIASSLPFVPARGCTSYMPPCARGELPSALARTRQCLLALLLSAALSSAHGSSGGGAPPFRARTPAEVAPYPPMHWHSWGLYTHEDLVNETNMGEMAEALIASGMAAAGYDTINVVCNGWTGRDPTTGVLQQNRTLWPSGMEGFAKKLHGMTPRLKLGCYTSPRTKNCMCGTGPSGRCEEGTGEGYEQIDMSFFADIGCDHIMVDMPDSAPSTFRQRYALFGAAIANSSNPDMLFGVACSPAHSWKWVDKVGGHYNRIAGDIYDSWSAVLRQWDVAYSIPAISTLTRPGRYSYLDQMVIGDVPGRKGSAYGSGLSHDETVAHMSMWVMAASPLTTCTDVRNMSAEIKEILTNSEVLEVHKDHLAKMATRVDVGVGESGELELHSANLCGADFPACQEGPGDPGYPGSPCTSCPANWSVFEKPLHDNSSAVMVLNRGLMALNVSINLGDLGDSTHYTFSARDLWEKLDLGVFTTLLTVEVPAHGVRLLRMRVVPPPPPPTCPAGWLSHAPGFWAGHLVPSNNQPHDTVNVTADACARKCKLTSGCLAFEIYQIEPKACYMFVDELQPPFTSNPDCFACVANHSRSANHSHTK